MRNNSAGCAISSAFAIFIVCLTFLGVAFADSQLTPIYTFSGRDGQSASGTLLIDHNSALYGVTQLGGPSNNGVVFKLTPPKRAGGNWTETLLHTFVGGADGSEPVGGLVTDTTGALYGTTTLGGDFNAGVIFKITPPNPTGGEWTNTVLYSFTGGKDGSSPSARLLLDHTGTIYGTTVNGGDFNEGVVFQLKPPRSVGGVWTENVLRSFKCDQDGCHPIRGLVAGKGGVLYGTTSAVKVTISAGAAFRLGPPNPADGKWTFTVLHRFQGDFKDGFDPNIDGIDKTGALYGESFGPGVVFKLMPPKGHSQGWQELVLHGFSSGRGDGGYGLPGLAVDKNGDFYGGTLLGGTSDRGVIFQVTPSGQETVLYNFTGGSDGGSPQGVVIDKNGMLYGTSGNVVFQLVP